MSHCTSRQVKLITSVLSDPSEDIFITLDGKKVAVPQGKPIDQPQFSNSHFSNSEYLIYKESQCRIRYLLELNMKYWLTKRGGPLEGETVLMSAGEG